MPISPQSPTSGIQAQWDRFDRWAKRYLRKTKELVDDLKARRLVDTPDYLCLLQWAEYKGIFVPPHEIDDLQVLEKRAKEKIEFLRGYLVDISFDGAEFMHIKSKFLPLQYQSKCNSSMGFWFEQWLDNAHPGAYHGYQGFDVVLFASAVSDIDFESVNTILPFDEIFIRQSCGLPWDQARANQVVQEIKADLGMGKRHFIRVDGVGSSLISVTFNKQMV